MEFKDDNPISNQSEDALGFAKSAAATAESIIAMKSGDGFVIGIEGEWGSGKTSYINLIKQSLKEQKPELDVIEFKPWLYSGREELIAAYFRYLMDKSPDVFDDARIKEDLQKLYRSINPFTSIISKAVSLMPGGETIRAIGEVAGKLLESEVSLQAQLEKIEKRLINAEEKKQFVVVIDDLDRLEPDEIKTMLQLVKSVGRLPFVTYILAYDRVYVESCVNHSLPVGHPSFLEKIIQMQIALPSPREKDLHQLLEKNISFITGDIETKERWGELKKNAVLPYIKKPRDVVLLTNALSFSYSALKGVIDPADLIALECLRLFDAGLWSWIRRNRLRLLDEHNSFDNFEGVIEKDDIWRFNLIGILFPQSSKGITKYSNLQCTPDENYQEYSNRAGVASAVACEGYFSRYVRDEEIINSDIDEFFDLKDEKSMQVNLEGWIARLGAKGEPLIHDFLESIYRRLVVGQVLSEDELQQVLNAMWAIRHQILGSDIGDPYFGRDVLQNWRANTILLLRKLEQDFAERWYEDNVLNKDIDDIYVNMVRSIYPENEGNFDWQDALVSESFAELNLEKIRDNLTRKYENGSIGETKYIFKANGLLLKLCENPRDAYKAQETAIVKSESYALRMFKGMVGDAEFNHLRNLSEYRSIYDLGILVSRATELLSSDLAQEDKMSVQKYIEFAEAVN